MNQFILKFFSTVCIKELKFSTAVILHYFFLFFVRAVGPSGSSDSIYKVWKIGIIACGVITGIFTFM